jgi:hypothetical protein
MHGSMSAAGGNQASRASTRRTAQAPPADPTATAEAPLAPASDDQQQPELRVLLVDGCESARPGHAADG